MQIHGFQKLTLLDFPEKVACIVFTAGCNFRCPFCHNASLVTHISSEQEIPEEEIFSYLDKRRALLDGVCLTGGEPLLQKDIASFLRKVKQLGYSVKIDTNGTSPTTLKMLVENGLVDYVAMDIKNSADKYALTCGCTSVPFDDIRESIRFLLEGNVDYEFRTTVTAEYHTPEDIREIAAWIRGARRYYIQVFKDSGDIISTNIHAPDDTVLQQMKQSAVSMGIEVELR